MKTNRQRRLWAATLYFCSVVGMEHEVSIILSLLIKWPRFDGFYLNPLPAFFVYQNWGKSALERIRCSSSRYSVQQHLKSSSWTFVRSPESFNTFLIWLTLSLIALYFLAAHLKSTAKQFNSIQEWLITVSSSLRGTTPSYSSSFRCCILPTKCIATWLVVPTWSFSMRVRLIRMASTLALAHLRLQMETSILENSKKVNSTVEANIYSVLPMEVDPTKDSFISRISTDVERNDMLMDQYMRVNSRMENDMDVVRWFMAQKMPKIIKIQKVIVSSKAFG